MDESARAIRLAGCFSGLPAVVVAGLPGLLAFASLEEPVLEVGLALGSAEAIFVVEGVRAVSVLPRVAVGFTGFAVASAGLAEIAALPRLPALGDSATAFALTRVGSFFSAMAGCLTAGVSKTGVVGTRRVSTGSGSSSSTADRAITTVRSGFGGETGVRRTIMARLGSGVVAGGELESIADSGASSSASGETWAIRTRSGVTTGERRTRMGCGSTSGCMGGGGANP